jgi:hypothetical protein
MTIRCRAVGLTAAILVELFLVSQAVVGCAVAPPPHVAAVNADQTVILIWDAVTKTQHFIRQASFKTESADVGFIVPTPTQPDLQEAGDGAFDLLRTLTAPEVHRVWQPRFPFGCSAAVSNSHAGLAAGSLPPVRVLEEKLVAGFNAVVLESSSGKALVAWLEEHGYAYSQEVADWAAPYITLGWKFTALKVAKDVAGKDKQTVAASALRLSFHTDRPLFPYREPDPRGAAKALGASDRLLRIYFIAEARYEGELTRHGPWSGKVVWAGQVPAKQRGLLLESLRLPATTGPAEWYLTEIEDHWPYRPAPADVYFHRSVNQDFVRRPPVIQYVLTGAPIDLTVCALVMMMAVPVELRRRGKERSAAQP